MAAADPRLILRDEELDAGLELMMLAEAALWAGVDAGLEAENLGLGRSHWRAAFLLKRRPGVGVQELARLTSLSKQAASRILGDLEAKGLVEKVAGDLDGRRPGRDPDRRRARPSRTVIAERLRGLLARSYRTGGLDGVAGSPADPVGPGRRADEERRRLMAATDTADRHLLVVDDDNRIRDLLKEYLTRNGFRVTAAPAAAAARKLMETLDFDLAVFDVMMPGEDGFSLTKWLRERKGAAGRTPVLMLTAKRPGRGPHRGPEARRRRLSGQAVRAGGAAAAHRGDPAPRPGPAGGGHRRGALAGPLPVRSRARRADLRGRAGPPDRGRGRPAASAWPAARTSRWTGWSWPATPSIRPAAPVDVQVTRLRRKIETDPKAPRYLQTVRGVGYLLAPD